jgi:hypothetical protein
MRRGERAGTPREAWRFEAARLWRCESWRLGSAQELICTDSRAARWRAMLLRCSAIWARWRRRAVRGGWRKGSNNRQTLQRRWQALAATRAVGTRLAHNLVLNGCHAVQVAAGLHSDAAKGVGALGGKRRASQRGHAEGQHRAGRKSFPGAVRTYDVRHQYGPCAPLVLVFV